MSWLSARQSVLAENVANGDTPNFVARDLKPVDFQAMLAGQGMGSTQLTTTNARHFEIRASGAAPFEEEDAFGEGGVPTGNVVSVEQEMI
jgi:flagellar basal-body rod protein FlgB